MSGSTQMYTVRRWAVIDARKFLKARSGYPHSISQISREAPLGIIKLHRKQMPVTALIRSLQFALTYALFAIQCADVIVAGPDTDLQNNELCDKRILPAPSGH